MFFVESHGADFGDVDTLLRDRRQNAVNELIEGKLKARAVPATRLQAA